MTARKRTRQADTTPNVVVLNLPAPNAPGGLGSKQQSRAAAEATTGPAERTVRTGRARRRHDAEQEEIAALQQISPFLARQRREELQRRQSRTLHKLEPQLRPWLMAAGVYGFAAVLWLSGALGASSASLATVAAGVGSTVIAATWLIARNRLPQRWRLRIWAALFAGTAWTSWAAWTGPSRLVLLSLLVTTVILSAAWWRHHRPGYPTQAPEPIEAEDPSAGLTIPELWAQYVAAKGKALPDSYLFAPDHKETAEAKVEGYTVQLSRGDHTLMHAVGAMDRVASGIGVPPRKIVFEDLGGDSDPSTILLKIVHRSPADDPRFDHPRYDAGLLEIGPYIDGDGEAVYRLYTAGERPNEGSMWSGAIIAATSYGKSRMIENLAVSALSAANTVIWFICPQGGASSPALMRNCDWFADKEGADIMLSAFERIAEARGMENAAEGWIGFDPSPQRPGLWLIIDESHEVVDKRMETLVRKIRKLGMGVLLASQSSGLDTFAGSDVMRGSVMAGNTIAMYTSSNVSGQLMAGLEVDPKTLPKVPGYGYTQRVGATGRTAPFRNRLISDTDEWMAAQPKVELDPLSANAAGDVYFDRHETAAAAAQNLMAKVQAMRSGVRRGRPADQPRPDRTATPAASAARPAGTASTGEFTVPVFPTAPQLKLVTSPDRPQDRPQDQAQDQAQDAASPRTEAGPEAGKATARTAIVTALTAAPARELQFGELLEVAIPAVAGRSYSETAVRNALAELQADGEVTKSGHGRYRLTDQASGAHGTDGTEGAEGGPR